MYPLRRLAPMLLVVVALGTTPACDHAPARPEPDLTVELKDFEVGLSTARTESGRVVFDLAPGEVDEATLRLIYRNYDDPDGAQTLAAAAVENVLDVAVKRL